MSLATKRVIEMTPEERERRRASRAASSLRKYHRLLAIVQEFKSQPCVDCGRDDLPSEIMQLDHVRGVKLFTVANKLASRSEAAVRAEMEKCDVRCPTCHALRHYAEKQLGVVSHL